MGLTEIKKEVDQLRDDEQRELLVYLSHQREIKDPAYLEGLTQTLDNTSSERWVSLDTLKEDQ